MAHDCRLLAGGRTLPAHWRRDGDSLIVVPSEGPPRVLALGDIAGIAGDGFTITLQTPVGEVTLDRLGADGPTLLQDLRRDWPPLRARVLRLSTGKPPDEIFAGRIEDTAYAGNFRGFVVEGRLLVAPEGGDLYPLFLADCRAVAFSEADYDVHWTGWQDEKRRFYKLGTASAAFSAALSRSRETLAVEADATLARHLPSLDPGLRVALAWEWLPGRVLSFADLEALAPGFETAFLESWLKECPRTEEGISLMAGVASADRFLGYSATDPTLMGEEGEAALWLLVKDKDSPEGWSLEFLTHGDYATYLFTGDRDMPQRVAGIVRLPEFSREALYMPLAEMTGDRQKYAVPARQLAVLSDLRAHFTGRRIHPPRAGRPSDETPTPVATPGETPP